MSKTTVDSIIKEASELIAEARHVTAFTGAGISVESGIPPFRGPGGLWNRIDPSYLEIDFFLRHPLKSWEVIRQLFYQTLRKARPNLAHRALAKMEKAGLIRSLITQNIDYLHQLAGSQTVYEFHGTYRFLRCMSCNQRLEADEKWLENLPPACPACGGLLKPDFVFFGEPIPEVASQKSFIEADVADVFLIIGSTGEVYPAAQIPQIAFSHGSKIIEINIEPSNYTTSITHLFLQGKATEMMKRLCDRLNLKI